ncbi:uncharacterized protein N7477_005565 [Penicillium maclennaniae]|uniref:uncharacterized protein n=1 Tax=Penicillium maclennaniae TaxID=1343394 RepID=UPI0025400C60|nr:uncharacterized protein N7477_005565 [Penicillium maclennaniae]KAJ5670202.1 hypothetical protein N7477_005565 [Penicillium maclennaniae]
MTNKKGQQEMVQVGQYNHFAASLQFIANPGTVLDNSERAESPFWAGRKVSLNQSQSQSKGYSQNTVVGASYSHANILQYAIPSNSGLGQFPSG